VQYESGTRWPTRDPQATGWPSAQPTTQWPPPPAPGREDGVGWPGESWPGENMTGWPGDENMTGWPADAPRRRAEPRERRAGSRRAAVPAPAARGGSWRTYLLAGIVLLLVTSGLGGAIWRSGWLNQPPSRRAAPRPVTAVPHPGEPATPQPTSSTTTGALPAVVEDGAGTFTTVQSESRILGTAGTLRRFRIAVENGINEDPNAFATTVDQVLGDQRSWIASGQFRLQRVPSSAPAEFTIFLASPTTSEEMCAVGGLHTDKFTSCRLQGQVIINDARWLTAIPDYGASLEVYRAYAINHEVGHQLGHGHEACVTQGQLAPVMQQQTYGLKGCIANPWPFVNGQRYSGPPIP
jgi:hypothetical protein